MKQTTFGSKTVRQGRSTLQQDSCDGQNAVSIVPPDYGVDFVDSDQTAEVPLQRRSEASAQGMVQPEPVAQRQTIKEEEEEKPIQTKLLTKQSAPPVQRQPKEEEEEKVLQGTFAAGHKSAPFQANTGGAENRDCLPSPLRAGLEALSGVDLSDIRIHTNSSKPAQLNALAYTQGQDIHVGPGQEKHLPHEGWHAVQQMQGRVKPTMLAKGVSINDNAGLEREADAMGTTALQWKPARASTTPFIQSQSGVGHSVIQCQEKNIDLEKCRTLNPDDEEAQFECYFASLKDIYQGLFERQALAVRTLKGTAGKEDPPPFWQDLAWVAVDLALTAATGGIGAAVAIGVTNRLKKAVLDPKQAENFIKIASDMAKDGAKAATKKIQGVAQDKVKSAASQYPEGDPERAAKICFDAQEKSLIEAKTAAQVDFNAKKGELKRGGANGVETAKGMAEEINSRYNEAEKLQRSESIMQWAAYQAKGVRGQTEKGGTEMTKRSPGLFTADRGVLHIDASWLDGQSLKLTSASMEGMNAALRPNIAATPVGKLKVPIQIRLYIGRELSWADKYISHKTQPVVTIKRNEAGQIWASFGGNQVWLARKAGHQPQQNIGRGGRIWETATDAQAFDGVGVVFEKMKDVRPPLK